MSPFHLKQIVAGVAVCAASFGAQAALTTYAPWEAAYSGNGLSGVLFDVQTGGGVTTAMGAHAYKNGAFLANDGVNQFFAAPGTFAGPPAEPDRANWSFDFGWSYGSCTTCSVWLGVDTDYGTGTNFTYGQVGNAAGALPGVSDPESWNMLMSFLVPGFNTGVESHTSFRLEVYDGQSRTSNLLSASEVTVNVPEPASLALVAVALAGAGAARRRRA
jgi:hypothetical protein